MASTARPSRMRANATHARRGTATRSRAAGSVPTGTDPATRARSRRPAAVTSSLMRAVLPAREQRGDSAGRARACGSARTASTSSSNCCARREVDRPAVVGIDEAEVPELGALVEVRHARRAQLQHDLRQRVHHARRCAMRRANGGTPAGTSRRPRRSARAPRTARPRSRTPRSASASWCGAWPP